MGAQAIAAVIIAAILTAGAGVVYGLMPKLKNSAALEEVSILAHAAAEASFYIGSVDSFQTLVTNGYVDKGSYSDGVGENEYGNTITTVSDDDGLVAFTYVTDESEECLYIKSQIDRKVPTMSGDASCATTTLSFNIDKIRG